MLIKRLEVKGFKSLRDVVWEPGPLTVLIGPNGSGKSNLLGSLDVIKFSAKCSLEKHLEELGGITSILWDGQIKSATFSVILGEESNNENIESCIEYSFDINDLGEKNDYDISREYLDIKTITNIGYKKITHISKDKNYKILVHNKDKTFTQINNSYDFFKHETVLSFTSNPLIDNNEIAGVHKKLIPWTIFNPILISKQAAIRKPVVTSYEKNLNPSGQNLVNVLHTLYSEDRNFENDINTAMRAAFGDDFDRLVFPPAADQLVQLRIRWKTLKREQSMADLSDGTIRFLFLMTVLCNPDPAPLIAIDEPETGLHPSMFRIIAEYAAEASKRTQVIFSTHSPQFLDAFSDFDVTTTVTAWKDGETKIKNLDGDTLKQWLEHYSLGSLFLSGDLEALA